jgi:hypothetical protein
MQLGQFRACLSETPEDGWFSLTPG